MFTEGRQALCQGQETVGFRAFEGVSWQAGVEVGEGVLEGRL